MISTSDLIKAWSYAGARTEPLIILYDIPVSDSTTLHLVSGNPTGSSISYGGFTYLPVAISRQELEQSTDGELGTFVLAISNINGVAGGYIETSELDGRTITETTLVLHSDGSIDAADAMVQTYTILNQSYDRKTASITVGLPNFFKIKGRKKYVRGRCQWDWANRFQTDNLCGYPSDQFQGDTRQNIRLAATVNTEEQHRFGWYALNALKTYYFDVDGTILENLGIGSLTPDINWQGANRNAPFAYKKISGDFDVWTKADPYLTRSGSTAGILCQEDAANWDTWVFLGRFENNEGTMQIKVSAELDQVPQTVVDPVSGEGIAYLRLSRVGNVFTCRYSASGSSWTTLGTVTLAMVPEVRLGLALAAPDVESGLVAVGFPVFQFVSGGLADCSRTLEACEARGNVHHYGAFPGIPRK